MKTRVTQLFARYVGVAMMALAGWLGAGEDQAESIAEMAGTVAAGVIGFGGILIDLLIHKAETGGVMARPGDVKNGNRLDSPTSRVLTLFLLPAVLIGASGCSATPKDAWLTQRDALTTANRVYIAASPMMSAEQRVEYGELLQAARMSLEKAQAKLPDGGLEFEAYLDVVESILAKWSQQQLKERYNDDSSGNPLGDTGRQSGTELRDAGVSEVEAARSIHARAGSGDPGGGERIRCRGRSYCCRDAGAVLIAA